MNTPQSESGHGGPAPVNLGLRLRLARQESGQSLRELARKLGVSPSFVSQIENGKAQPSVATLYSMAQLLGVSIDRLFQEGEPLVEPSASVRAGADAAPADRETPNLPSIAQRGATRRQSFEQTPSLPVQRSDLGELDEVWKGTSNTAPLSITLPGHRTTLEMDCGVTWEQLTTNTAHQIDFIQITYPPGASSTSDERMLRHEGFEYGYLLEGELEVTLGFEKFTLHAGESLGLDSSIPHLFRNPGTVPAKGIWFVHHRHD